MDTFFLLLLFAVTAPIWFPFLIFIGVMLGLLIAVPIVVVSEAIREARRFR